MIEVTRYDIAEDSDGIFDVWPVPPRLEGRFVKYEDYAALLQRLEASEALMLAMRDDSRESRSKLELITAECAALVNYIDGECYTESNRTGVYTCAGINKPASPATNAMVNEIRAESVISFVEHYAGNLRTAGGGDGYHPEPYHDMADHIEAKCELYVDQLRADADKGGSDDK